MWHGSQCKPEVQTVSGTLIHFEDGEMQMRPGDFVNIPAHKRHRVEWKTPDEPTVWLAVFYE